MKLEKQNGTSMLNLHSNCSLPFIESAAEQADIVSPGIKTAIMCLAFPPEFLSECHFCGVIRTLSSVTNALHLEKKEQTGLLLKGVNPREDIGFLVLQIRLTPMKSDNHLTHLKAVTMINI